jgi:hypothetical protein
MTKNLGVAITDDADQKLSEIMEIKGFKNRADAVEYLIQQGFKQAVQAKLKEAQQ